MLFLKLPWNKQNNSKNILGIKKKIAQMICFTRTDIFRTAEIKKCKHDKSFLNPVSRFTCLFGNDYLNIKDLSLSLF